MNSTERVMAAIKGEPTSRRAAALTLSLYGASLIKCPLDKYYSNANFYAEGQHAVRETFKPDILLAPFALPLLGAAFGSTLRYFSNHPPNILEPACKNPEQISALSMPDVDSEPTLLYIRESIRIMARNAKGQYPISAIALSPIDLPIMLLGIETWLHTALFNNELAKTIIEFSTEFFLKWTNALFKDGVTCVILPAPFANLRIVTPKFFSETAIPNLEASFSQCAGPLIMHHCGTSYSETLEYIKDLPNSIGFCVGKEDTLSEARIKIGNKPLLLGNIDGPSLHKLSPETIYKHTCKILEDRKDDHHFILATSAADIDIETPVENIHAITKAVNEFNLEKVGNSV